jgi:short-subunit dehydrogenase involved in D-alanine esterification of teichoic acids
MPVSSGLAFTHSPWVPSYGATKAALHSFTASLRVQLKATNVNVIEVIPPLVESELHDGKSLSDGSTGF